MDVYLILRLDVSCNTAKPYAVMNHSAEKQEEDLFSESTDLTFAS